MTLLILRVCAFLAVVLGFSAPAAAHPHVFVDARAEIVFDQQGRLSAVRHIWQFDEAFTAYATLNLDEDNDGQLTQEELEPLARTNVESLAEFDFFTWLKASQRKAAFLPPDEYFLQFHGTRLTLYYTLPLATPLTVSGDAELEVYDPEYFVAFNFEGDIPAVLDGAPDGCSVTYTPPGDLDAQTATILAQIPMDQRELPEELAAITYDLANVLTISCPVVEGAVEEEVAAPAPARPRPPSPFGVGTSDAPSAGWLRGPLGPFFMWIGEQQSSFYKALTSTFADIKADGRAAWLLMGLSFLYGIFHAAGPGHGKAVITSYLFASGDSVRRGILISFISAFVQAFSAIAIVGIAAVIFRAAASTMTVATQWIEIASYALIVLVGVGLLWSKTMGGGHCHHHHHHHDGHGHDHGDDAHDHDHNHHHHHHDHHEHDHTHAHDHSHHHAPATSAKKGGSLMALVSAVLAIGLRPCSGAIIILVFAISQGMFAVGIASTLIMAVGTGITVAALAALAVSARGLAERLAGADSVMAARVVRGLEITAALLVLLLGITLLGGALAAGLPGFA